MNPLNWISATGRKPWAARPTDIPAITFSASGVSSTRSFPKRFNKPSVARNTPPSTPTSSPRTRTVASSAMARASARLTASTSVISGIAVSPLYRAEGGFALLDEVLWQSLVGIIEYRLRSLGRGGKIALGRPFDGTGHLAKQPFLIGFAPKAFGHQVVAQPRDRVLRPMGADVGPAAVTTGIIGGGVITQTIGQRFDQMRPTAGSGFGERASGRRAHRNDIVAVDLLAFDAGGDRLLGERFGGRLLSDRHRDGPVIVVDDKDRRQIPHAGNIQRLGNIALGGGAVAKDADRDPLFPPQLKR